MVCMLNMFAKLPCNWKGLKELLALKFVDIVFNTCLHQLLCLHHINIVVYILLTDWW